MATSEYSITIQLKDDETLEYLTKPGYEVNLSYPLKNPDWFIHEPELIDIDNIDDVNPVRESTIRVDFKAVSEVTYWISYALPNGEIQEHFRLKIEPGQIYEFGINSPTPEGRIITGDVKENWAPGDGFGFHNGFSASPVLYRNEPGDLTKPSTGEILELWVPGTGIVYPPPTKFHIWFEKPLGRDPYYSDFTTVDQSEKLLVPFEFQESDVKVYYSEKTGWALSEDGVQEARPAKTAPVKPPVEAAEPAPVKAPAGTVSEGAAPNGIPGSGQTTTKKLAARRRVL